MAQVPYPINADNIDDLKRQLWELVRAVYEDYLGGTAVGDVFTSENAVLELNILPNGGLEKTLGYLRIKLNGDSLQLTTEGLSVGQSGHIADPTGGATIDSQARASINLILDLLEERGLMAAS